MDDFLQFLREPIAQRSLLACLMIGFANGFVSGLVILKKSALQIGTLSCALLPGIAVAVLMFGLTRWSLLLGAVVAALLVGLGSLFVSRTSRLNQDTALSILHTTAFAAGFIVLVRLGLQQRMVAGDEEYQGPNRLFQGAVGATVAVVLVVSLGIALIVWVYGR